MLLSATTAALVSGSAMPEGVSKHDLGDVSLKDLDEPERVVQLEIDGLPSSFPPLRAEQEEPMDFGERLAQRIKADVERQLEESFAGARDVNVNVHPHVKTTKMAFFGLLNLVLLVAAIVAIVLLDQARVLTPRGPSLRASVEGLRDGAAGVPSDTVSQARVAPTGRSPGTFGFDLLPSRPPLARPTECLVDRVLGRACPEPPVKERIARGRKRAQRSLAMDESSDVLVARPAEAVPLRKGAGLATDIGDRTALDGEHADLRNERPREPGSAARHHDRLTNEVRRLCDDFVAGS